MNYLQNLAVVTCMFCFLSGCITGPVRSSVIGHEQWATVNWGNGDSILNSSVGVASGIFVDGGIIACDSVVKVCHNSLWRPTRDCIAACDKVSPLFAPFLYPFAIVKNSVDHESSDTIWGNACERRIQNEIDCENFDAAYGEICHGAGQVTHAGSLRTDRNQWQSLWRRRVDSAKEDALRKYTLMLRDKITSGDFVSVGEIVNSHSNVLSQYSGLHDACTLSQYCRALCKRNEFAKARESWSAGCTAGKKKFGEDYKYAETLRDNALGSANNVNYFSCAYLNKVEREFLKRNIENVVTAFNPVSTNDFYDIYTRIGSMPEGSAFEVRQLVREDKKRATSVVQNKEAEIWIAVVDSIFLPCRLNATNEFDVAYERIDSFKCDRSSFVASRVNEEKERIKGQYAEVEANVWGEVLGSIVSKMPTNTICLIDRQEHFIEEFEACDRVRNHQTFLQIKDCLKCESHERCVSLLCEELCRHLAKMPFERYSDFYKIRRMIANYEFEYDCSSKIRDAKQRVEDRYRQRQVLFLQTEREVVWSEALDWCRKNNKSQKLIDTLMQCRDKGPESRNKTFWQENGPSICRWTANSLPVVLAVTTAWLKFGASQAESRQGLGAGESVSKFKTTMNAGGALKDGYDAYKATEGEFDGLRKYSNELVTQDPAGPKLGDIAASLLMKEHGLVFFVRVRRLGFNGDFDNMKALAFFMDNFVCDESAVSWFMDEMDFERYPNELVSAVDENGETALMYAAKKGNALIVRWLLSHGAQKDLKSKVKWFGMSGGKTALDFALEGKHEDVILLLK